MSDTVIFRCDASAEIGSGHVMRCVTLGEELQRRGWTCRLVGLPGTLSTVAPFAVPEFEVIEIEAADDPVALRALAPEGCDLLVVDSYLLGVEFEAALAGWASRRMVIDDRPLCAHDTEILLDQTLGRKAGAYDGLVQDSTHQLLGPGFALLRPGFAATRGAALARRENEESVTRLLVALGGTPSADVLDLVLAGIDEASLAAEVHLVAGAAAMEPTVAGRARLVVHQSTQRMHELMMACDVAVGAGGISAWERCCLGLPTLLIRTADNQNDSAEALAAAGAAIDLGPVAEISPGTLATALRRLEQDPAGRAALAHNAARVCDGLGARRVAGIIAPRRAGDGIPVTLRSVTDNDDRLTFAWQQIPAVRRHTPNPRAPTWEEHLQWFRRRVGNATRGPFSIIEYGGQPAGMLRLDACDPECLGLPAEPECEAYLVSILVDPAYHSRGVGGAALACGRDLLPDATLYAEVLPSNEASRRLFQGAGYRLVRSGLYLSELRPCWN